MRTESTSALLTVRGSEMAAGQLYAYPKDAWHGVAAVRITKRVESDGLGGWECAYKLRGGPWGSNAQGRLIYWDACGYEFAERVE